MWVSSVSMLKLILFSVLSKKAQVIPHTTHTKVFQSLYITFHHKCKWMGLLPHSVYQQCEETVLFESWLPEESLAVPKLKGNWLLTLILVDTAASWVTWKWGYLKKIRKKQAKETISNMGLKLGTSARKTQGCPLSVVSTKIWQPPLWRKKALFSVC